MDREEFLSVVEDLKRGPARLRELLARVPAEEEARRPSPDAFSVREHVHHLRDLEAEGYGLRLLRLLGENDPVFEDIDGARLALERDYAARPCHAALEEFTLLRAANVERLLRLSPEDLRRGGSWPGVGPVTLEEAVVLWRNHDREHLDDLSRLVRQGA